LNYIVSNAGKMQKKSTELETMNSRTIFVAVVKKMAILFGKFKYKLTK